MVVEVTVRSRLLPGPLTLVGVLVVALVGGWALAAPFHVEVAAKRLDGLEWPEAGGVPAAATQGLPTSDSLRTISTDEGGEEGPGVPPTRSKGRVVGDALPLRLVDMGGVGIPADTAAWGTTYSHATHAFDQLILDGDPWIDPVGAGRIREDWRRYLTRMAGMGSTAVILDLFLELVNFDSVGSGSDVYPAGHPLRARHRAYRAFVQGLASDAAERGMEVYLKTDLPAVTPPLRHYLSDLPGGADPSTRSFWALYAAAFDEVFEELPGVAGAVVRVGEAGPLYNVEGLAYASYMGVREPAELQEMLRTLLPVFEERGRTLIFRSWSVGVGPLGDLHNDPEVYQAVLGPIQSPALVVATKFVQGDYFGFLPLNPTLLVGEHRRIIEYQARREYEGFGALPNYLGHAHATALRQVLRANPRVVGTSIWTQEGGPLRAGPLSLFDVTGFWRWTDANVYATARLALDPGSDPRTLAEEWARITFGADREGAEALADILVTSREAMEKGFYIRPFAERRMAIVGVDTPPLLWVFEWDVVGGWSSVLASLYRALEGDIETPMDEGWEAVALTRRMRDRLDGLAPRIGDHPDFPAMRASLDYQLSMFTALADFRESFLRYYAWLDGGGDATPWHAAARRFQASAGEHMAIYGDDLDFPALDFAPALASTEAALRGGRRTASARLLGGLILAGLLLGTGWSQARTGSYPGRRIARWLWILGSGSGRLDPGAGPPPRGLTSAVALVWVGVAASVALLVPDPLPVALGVGCLGLAYAWPLAVSWSASAPSGPAGRGPWRQRPPWALASAVLSPFLWLALAVLLAISVRGPDHLWFLFWTDDLFRTLLFAGVLGLGLWTVWSSFRIGERLAGGSRSARRRRFAGGSVLVALGAAVVVLAGLLPDLEGILAALDEPLRLLPMRRAIINGITHYAGLEAAPPHLPAIVGATLVALGLVLRGRGPRGVAPP